MIMARKITKDDLIGDVIKMHAEVQKVIEKYFGSGCFTCPGIRLESIAFGATMHNIDPEAIVKEINETLQKIEGCEKRGEK